MGVGFENKFAWHDRPCAGWSVCVLSLCLALQTCVVADEDDDAFENQIRPVLVEACFGCHGDPKESGELRVDSRDALIQGGESGPAIVPGSPESSLLFEAIQRHADVSAMPPDSDKALRSEQIVAFEKWIRAGAHWPANVKKFESVKHWAFEPIRAIEPARSSESENAIDALLRTKQQAAGIEPASKVDKLTLIRRATFDLTGLPPTPEEIAAFVQDTSETAYDSLLNRLLESKEYGVRWGRHWLDIVRYADTAGETADYPVPLAWRYRNYVIDSFNADKPYDQFIQEQVAGDILATQASRDRYSEQITATGYLAISRRFGFDSENYHHLTIQDTIDNLGQSILGLSLGCARCHDHKFDPVSMQDYYGLYAVFDSSRYSFPGSEQKQRVRSMAPLLPPSEALPKWRAFDQRVAFLVSSLEKRKQPVPSAILRSLHDMDGDFEMQAPAAGGSNGVLVSPWLYEGKIAVTNGAQSPFKNLYARGIVGASIAPDAGPYRIAQSIYPQRSPENCNLLNLNLDFRVEPNSKATGAHRLWIGMHPNSPKLLVSIRSGQVTVQCGQQEQIVGDVASGEWHNLQLQWNLHDGKIGSSLSTSSRVQTIVLEEALKLNDEETIGLVVIETAPNEVAPAIEFDNLGIQDDPIPSATTALPSFASEKGSASDLASDSDLIDQLNKLVGTAGDFEFQSEGQPPDKPWNPGPNSVVKITSAAQSSLTSLFPLGRLGVHMPNRGEYDGFGLTLPQTWKQQDTESIFATFDLRIVESSAGGDGSWRFYIGHGPGNSAAVELFFNGKQIFQRSGDVRESVSSIGFNQWTQVRIAMDLKSKKYTGTIESDSGTVTFQGDFATGWDGAIDYSFIDSYGHIGGVRPGIDVDNYEIRSNRFEALTEQDSASQLAARSENYTKAIALRKAIDELKNKARIESEELNRLLIEGPFEMAYSVSEGTPHNVKIHKRGEPSQPGDEVPRGFIKVLGDEKLEPSTMGSGRLELARWLTRTDNPLTSRVMVNRVWQHHFGVGLVKTPNDFGLRGLPPSQPELLDYLASEFMRNGWSVKSLHRMIMSSNAYQQTSKSNPNENTDRNLFSRFSRRRLSAVEIRDSILLVSGELDHGAATEHPFPSPISWGFSQHGPFNAVYDHNKRSIYLMTQRLKRHPYLALFDGADPNATTADRLGTTVPTQALYFLNDPFVYAKSEAWAKRLVEQFPTNAQRIGTAYLSAFARPVSQDEEASDLRFLEVYQAELATITPTNIEVASLAALLRTYFASNEFLHID